MALQILYIIQFTYIVAIVGYIWTWYLRKNGVAILKIVYFVVISLEIHQQLPLNHIMIIYRLKLNTIYCENDEHYLRHGHFPCEWTLWQLSNLVWCSRGTIFSSKIQRENPIIQLLPENGKMSQLSTVLTMTLIAYNVTIFQLF